ncbi:hypothetical protein [Nocardia heshunensis]
MTPPPGTLHAGLTEVPALGDPRRHHRTSRQVRSLEDQVGF